MPQLIGRRRDRGDRGAVATVVGVLLAGNVLLGMGALVIDVGLLYAEREQLQSGADAAAIAVAKACAASNDTCDPAGTQGWARDYAGRNAADGQSAATVCGRVYGAGSSPVNRVTPCGPATGNLTGCLGDPPFDPAPYVEVRTSTLLDGQTALPPVFAAAVTGSEGTTVGACSRVSWGPVLRADSGLAMAISICDFRAATEDGREFQPAPHDGDDDSRTAVAAEVAIRWRPPTDGGCTFNGHTFPAGFGWIPTDADCSRVVEVGAAYDAAPLPGSPVDCGNLLHGLHHSLTPVTVAIFDGVQTGPGGTTQLRVAGLGVFVITGWRMPGTGWPGGPDHDHPPNLHDADLCDATTSTMCVYGYFTTRVIRLGAGTRVGALGTPHFGAIYLRTIG